MTVYFIRPIGMTDGPVKIGCSEMPEHRLKTLGVWSPFPLEIVAEAEGDMEAERRVHALFAADHTHSEWFKSSPRLRDLIERIRAGATIASLVDFSGPLPRFRPARPTASVERRLFLSYSCRVRHAFRRLRGEDGLPRDLRCCEPRDVYDLLNNWLRGERRTPTEKELQRLEEVIANPAAHAITLDELFHAERQQRAAA